MDIERIKELHYITPVATVPSIMEHGILSHRRAAQLPHIDISMDEVQLRRSQKRVPGGKDLHQYANLYFDAHNPMLSKRRENNSDLCILRVSTEVLRLPNAVITDRNASSSYVGFYHSPLGLCFLDAEKIYSQFWTDNNPFEYMEKKSKKCAEVLVPDKVKPEYIFAAYVYDNEGKEKLLNTGFIHQIDIKPDIFFQVKK